MKRRKASRKVEFCLLDHFSELRNGYEIVAYYSKATKRYHATIDPAAGFRAKYQVYSWRRNSDYADGVSLSPYRQIASKRFGAADAAKIGLVRVAGEELRTVRCEFDVRCFEDGLLGTADGISMALNCYKSEHAELQAANVRCFDSFCRECARRLKGRIGELPEDLPKSGNCPWKTGRSARCDAACLRKCEMLWALRHPETAGEYHELLRPDEVGANHWGVVDVESRPQRARRGRGRKLRLVHSAALLGTDQVFSVREKATGKYHVLLALYDSDERSPTAVLSPDLNHCLGESDVNVTAELWGDRFENLGYVGYDAEADSAASAFERLCFVDGKRYFPDEVAEHLRQIIRFRDYCRDCKRVAKGACRMCVDRCNAVRRQDPQAACREDCLSLWALRHRREIEGWRKFKLVRVWDEMSRKAYETELKKRKELGPQEKKEVST